MVKFREQHLSWYPSPNYRTIPTGGVYVTELLLNGWTDLDDIFSVGSSGFENDLDSQFGLISQLVKNAPKVADPYCKWMLNLLGFPPRRVIAEAKFKDWDASLSVILVPSFWPKITRSPALSVTSKYDANKQSSKIY
ncbi:hypothetical protein TNCV_4169491 [Trichonephila clavipes]|nr:hypothetical protein TNCV_4169491 [Trichonephila clavipes]